MKNNFAILFVMLCLSNLVLAQSEHNRPDSVNTKSWDFGAEANLYFLPEDFFVNPIITANHHWLHLESRYNYEDLQTVSFFGGYNFSVGNKLTFDATPIIGFAVGNTNGIIPGFEATLAFRKWELYSETEYLISKGDHANSFLYTWSELTYSPIDWLYVGISAQRTRLYQTDLDVQRGILVGFTKGKVNLSGYLFNLGFDDPFFLLSIGISI